MELSVLILLATLVMIWAFISPRQGIYLSVIGVFWFGTLNIASLGIVNFIIFAMVVGSFGVVISNRNFNFNRRSMRILAIFGLYAIVEIFVWAAISRTVGENLSYFLSSVVRPAVVAISTLILVRDLRTLKNLAYVMLFASSVSAFVAFMQLIGVEQFWVLRELFGTDIYHWTIGARARPSGLADYDISLSYQVVSMLPLALALAIGTHRRRRISVLLLWGSFIILFLGVISSLTRSAIVAGLIGCVTVIILSSQGKLTRRSFKFSVGFGFVAIVGLVASSGFWLERFEVDPRTGYIMGVGRIALWQASFKSIRDHPLGTGHLAESVEGYLDYYGYGRELVRARELGLPTPGPHNQFINTAVAFGLPGVSLLILFYYKLFYSLKKAKKALQGDEVRGFLLSLVIGLIGSLVAYILNSVFHNDGPFRDDLSNWFIIGLALATFQLIFRDREIPSWQLHGPGKKL